MARYAIVCTAPVSATDEAGNPVTWPVGYITNVAEWDGNSAWSPGAGLEAVVDPGDEAVIGGSWDGTKFSPAAE